MPLDPIAILTLLSSFAIIVIGCEFFTNGIEWLGFKLKLSESATGSVLAAVGTAMPETMIPIIAILFGSTREIAQEIGIGAILGAPFMLSTLAMFVGGVTIIVGSALKFRSIDLKVDQKAAMFDLRFFFLVYTLAIIPAVINASHLRYAVALILVLCYVIYLKIVLSEMEPIGEAGNKLYLSRFLGMRAKEPHIAFISAQVLAALAMIIGGARIFVSSIETISTEMGVSAAILSFIIAPIATELPEKFNSVLWYLRSKDMLALGNVTGAMVFQSTMLPALGIAATDWHLESAEMGGMILAILSALILYLSMMKGRPKGYVLLFGGMVYVVYLWYVLVGIRPS